jgi:hypothetical protein
VQLMMRRPRRAKAAMKTALCDLSFGLFGALFAGAGRRLRRRREGGDGGAIENIASTRGASKPAASSMRPAATLGLSSACA